jgi:hypothetical protein
MLGNGSSLNIHYPPPLPGGLADADDSVVEIDREGVRGGVGWSQGDLGVGVWKLLSRGD